MIQAFASLCLVYLLQQTWYSFLEGGLDWKGMLRTCLERRGRMHAWMCRRSETVKLIEAM